MKVTRLSGKSREATREAAQWLALLDADDASDIELAGLERWRNSDPLHEDAWQRALLLRQRFADLPPHLALASLDRPDLGRRAAAKRMLGVATLLPAAWLLGRQLPVEVWKSDLHTATGEQKQHVWADGSSLLLNTNSAVDIDMAARQLRLLQGEIALTAAGSSPVTIRLPYGQAVVSRSEVCLRLYDQYCLVSVVNGSVQLSSDLGDTQTIRQGQQARLQADGLSALSTFDISLQGWRDGVLMAENQPLGDFLRELSRYRPGLLRWEPALERLRVTGSFRLDDTDRALALLAASLPLEVHARTRYWVTLVPKEKNA